MALFLFNTCLFLISFLVKTVQSKEGESRNISWTADYFPRAGLYLIFHVYNDSAKSIMQIGDKDPSTEKYVYHTRPLDSVNIQFEVKNITLQDAGYYVGGTSEADAWLGGGGVVLIVFGKPVRAQITGNLNLQVRKYAYLKCESRSTSAPSYYKRFPPLSYSWFVNNTRLNREVRETYSFIVSKDVKYNKYSCQAKEILESEKSVEIQINPLYGPETVLLTPEPPIDGLSVHDGDTFGPYTCSADCNPPCNVQWKVRDPSGGFRDATSLAASSVTVPEITANRTSMAMIRCAANGTEGKETSSIKLNIQFNTQESKIGESRNISWTADYFPKSGLYLIFHVYNNSASTIMQIRDSDPSTEKYVYHTRPINSVNIQFEVINITLQDAGYYVGGTSEADAWSGRGGTVLVVSGIPVKPIISGNLNIQVGKFAYLKCESSSTSAPSYYKKFPQLSYSWFVNNTRLEREFKETYSFIVTKDMKYNRYSCRAKETLESEKNDEIKINPLYGPETVLVTPEQPIGGLSIHDGDTFGPYTCSADCNPPCNVQWKLRDPLGGFRDVTPLGTSSVTVPGQKANRTSMELIRCVVNGTEGKEISSIKLNIQYLSDPKVYINGNLQNSLTVDERSPLFLACNMEGNPIPDTILKELTGNKILVQRSTTWLNHTLRREAVCSDTSTYSCEGSSSEFERKIQSFLINVRCDPRLDLTTVVKTNYGSMSGPDVNVPVTVPVVANPAISLSGITWSGPSATSILTNVDLQRDAFIYKQMIRSSIPIPDKRAFGNYSLMYKGKNIDITINAEDKPQPPLNFTGYSYASGYVNLTWISNFNGGLDQFFLLYLKEGSNWRDIKNLTDPGEGEVGSFDPGLLNTGQEYWFRLESCNRISCSSRSAEVKVTMRVHQYFSCRLRKEKRMDEGEKPRKANFTDLELEVLVDAVSTNYKSEGSKSAMQKGAWRY